MGHSHLPGALTMETSAHTVLSQWETFYVIVGSSGAALTGLMFVVITLAADSSVPRTPETLNAFGTPNVIHFVAVLLLSAILTAPWQRFRDPAHVLGATAIAGVVYVLVVLRRMLRQTGYKPVLEDWVWHLVLPMLGYAARVESPIGSRFAPSFRWPLTGRTCRACCSSLSPNPSPTRSTISGGSSIPTRCGSRSRLSRTRKDGPSRRSSVRSPTIRVGLPRRSRSHPTRRVRWRWPTTACAFAPTRKS